MQIKKIRILPNYRKQWAVALSRSIAVFLKSAGFSVVRDGADATVCVGGDGTIFYNIHKGRIEGAVLGIGSASSAVCQLRRRDWRKRIISFLKSSRTQGRMTLNASIGRTSYPSINDIVVHSNDYRVLGIKLNLGKRHCRFDADGIIFATGTGSTAYAYSAGGRVLSPKSKKIQIVPIAPYKRSFRPFVVAASSLKQNALTVSCNRSASLVIDGIFIRKIRKGEKVRILQGNSIPFKIF